MRKIRDVLRMHFMCKLTNREIAGSLGISPGSVSSYLNRAKSKGLGWPLPQDMTDTELDALIFPEKPAAGTHRPLPDCHHIHRELKRKGVTLFLLWHEYRDIHPTGLGYSRFCERYRAFCKTLDPVMRQVHAPGDSLFVDYSGLTVPWVDTSTGEVRHAEIFVAAIGASNKTFVLAQQSQALASWLDAHVKAFSFYGGVTNKVVPDNLRSGVTKSHRYDPDINRAYQDLADHYQVAVVPARARRPKDKAKAEVAVQCIQREILAPLRDHTFFSIHQINTAIAPLLAAFNQRQMQQLNLSRDEQFDTLDKPALKPLPIGKYQFADWKQAKAGIDYHVVFEKHYYSIPHIYLKQAIELRITERTIECFIKGKRIATHQRQYKPGHTTVKEHMPKPHQDYVEWSPERLQSWARKYGEETAALISDVIATKVVPQQAYRACLGILRLGKTYGKERLENAARRARHIGATRYKNVESILKNGLDTAPLPTPPSSSAVRSSHHDNVRGADYFN